MCATPHWQYMRERNIDQQSIINGSVYFVSLCRKCIRRGHRHAKGVQSYIAATCNANFLTFLRFCCALQAKRHFFDHFFFLCCALQTKRHFFSHFFFFAALYKKRGTFFHIFFARPRSGPGPAPAPGKKRKSAQKSASLFVKRSKNQQMIKNLR